MAAEKPKPHEGASPPSDGNHTVAGITVEEFLSTLTGKPSRETLDKIGAALADPHSEIHPFLRSFADFAKRATDPDAIDCQAYILPPRRQRRRSPGEESSRGRG